MLNSFGFRFSRSILLGFNSDRSYTFRVTRTRKLSLIAGGPTSKDRVNRHEKKWFR